MVEFIAGSWSGTVDACNCRESMWPQTEAVVDLFSGRVVNVAIVLATSRLGGSIFPWMVTLEADLCPFTLGVSVEADRASGRKLLFCRGIGLLVEAWAAFVTTPMFGIGLGMVAS